MGFADAQSWEARGRARRDGEETKEEAVQPAAAGAGREEKILRLSRRRWSMPTSDWGMPPGSASFSLPGLVL